MFSKDGEYVDWNQPVVCDGPAEVWLNSVGKQTDNIISKNCLMSIRCKYQNLEAAMRESLKKAFKQVKFSLTKNLKTREKWILEWPGQLCIIVSQVNKNKCTKVIVKG